MNEISYGDQTQRYGDESHAPYPAQYPSDSVATQDLAQQILMGMQHDIEAQIDWRLKKQGAPGRGFAPSEIGVILGSLGISIPLIAIAAASAGLAGIIVVAVMLVSINGAWASMVHH